MLLRMSWTLPNYLERYGWDSRLQNMGKCQKLFVPVNKEKIKKCTQKFSFLFNVQICRPAFSVAFRILLLEQFLQIPTAGFRYLDICLPVVGAATGKTDGVVVSDDILWKVFRNQHFSKASYGKDVYV